MRQESLLTDLYQLTMMYGYYKSGRMDQRVVFDLFYRNNPCGSGFALFAGLEQAIMYLRKLAFHEDEIAYLRGTGLFDEAFLDLLRNFRFTGDVYAVPEGTVVFPHEPLLRLEGRIFELQLVESALLTFINHQSLIATKAVRMTEATQGGLIAGQPVSEFGLRRAQNADAALFGARAAYIGGCSSTSNVLAGFHFGIPVSGTQAHSWIQSFGDELTAFRAYADAYPTQCVLLVDTYDVLRSGIPHAICVGLELRDHGHELYGIRIDSGDLAYLSKAARKQLDRAGFPDVKIIVSDDLDEETIRDLLLQGAPIDAWGVGTSLITAKDCPALGGVYKLAAQWVDGRYEPLIKVSENPAKVTNPGKKRSVRFYVDGTASADLLLLDDEALPNGEPVTLFDPIHTYKRKTVKNYVMRELLVPILSAGKLVYVLPSLEQIRETVRAEVSTIAPETRRAKNPHVYHVDLSQTLWELKRDLVHRHRLSE
ncbi:MAG: nicotinate phosphoribosyltransferase [Firmicutes bacterium]|nr:nicotinate phosphoribosyltransferase [Bacillota bacterium]